jgi:hypothetical protein
VTPRHRRGPQGGVVTGCSMRSVGR